MADGRCLGRRLELRNLKAASIDKSHTVTKSTPNYLSNHIIIADIIIAVIPDDLM